MSIHVTDFKWEKGKNDLEYIALLEKNIDVMANNFRECSKVAREQYNKGKTDERTKVIGEIETFCTEYNNKFKCIGECNKCPLGSFKEQMKGDKE